MTRQLTFRPQAWTELLEVRRWYEGQRAALGEEFGQEAHRAFSLLLRTPEAFPRVHQETRRIRLHRFPYAIYFRVLGDEVIVLAVMHGQRHPRLWRSRR